jgi:hypothetical protein
MPTPEPIILKDHMLSVAEWQTAFLTAHGGNPPSLETIHEAIHVVSLLLQYQVNAMTGKVTDSRKVLLHDLAAVAQAHVEKNPPGSPYYANFATLGMQAAKQLKVIDRASKGWGVARKFFAPSRSPHQPFAPGHDRLDPRLDPQDPKKPRYPEKNHENLFPLPSLGPNRSTSVGPRDRFTPAGPYDKSPHGSSAPLGPHTLGHHNIGAANPTSDRNYWLESLDPKHRPWGHSDDDLVGEVKGLFGTWMDDSTTRFTFFEWLEHHNLGEGLPQVQYLAVDGRWQYMVEFAGNCMYRRRSQLSSEATKFSTKELSSKHSGAHYAIWVCSPQGDFFTAQHVVQISPL